MHAVRADRDYERSMGCKSRLARSGAVDAALALALSISAGCASAPTPRPAPVAQMPLPDTTRAAPRAEARADWRDDDVPPAPHAKVDTRACEPAGKTVVVAARDADGHPDRWRYFETRHGRRLLTCEAADANGDGKIDARYFYDASGRLVLEQRDLDFDGHAEIVADYSQFKPRRPAVHARHLQ